MNSLCEMCVNATGGCSWSFGFVPVIGWDAVPVRYSDKYGWSYKVIKCPKYEKWNYKPKKVKHTRTYKDDAYDVWQTHLERLDKIQEEDKMFRDMERCKNMNLAVKDGNIGVCPWCGTRFIKESGGVFCCDGCRISYNNLHGRVKGARARMAKKINCVICGKPFTPSHKSLKCCSLECCEKNIKNYRRKKI